MIVDAAQELLRLLAVSASTGALEVTDAVSGTVYLTRGRVSFVEAAGIPDVGTRLVRSGVVGEQGWRAVMAKTDERSGRVVAARQGMILDPAVREVVMSAVVDAAAALMPGTGSGSCRFHPGRRHWAAGAVSLDLDSLLGRVAEARSGADSVTGADVPRLGPATASAVVLDARDWALIEHVDGQASIAELAWRCGEQVLALSAGVSRLVGSGVCLVEQPRRPAPALPSVVPAITPLVELPAELPAGTPAEPPVEPPAEPPVELPVDGAAAGSSRSVDLPPTAPVDRIELPRRRPGAQLTQPTPAPVSRRTQGGEPSARRLEPVAVLPGVIMPARPDPSGQFMPARDPALLRRLLAGLRRLD